METLLVPAQRHHLPVLANLFQLYSHDFAEVVPLFVGDDGRFAVPALEPYWQDPSRHAFLIRVADHWAGFALAHQCSRLTDDRGTWDVAEFFVMRGFRRSGVGARAAAELFARFPGRWEVRQIHANTIATAFWRHAIAGFTGAAVVETVHDTDRWQGPVQTFVSDPSRR
jgi:predicted acetyltransferase